MAAKKRRRSVDPIVVDIQIGSLKTGGKRLSKDQVCRLMASLGNQVMTWMRHDLKDTRDIPVVCNEGNGGWSSEDDKCFDK